MTFRDFIGETATARVAREKLLEAWRVDPSQFKVRPNNQGVEYKPDGSDADRTLKFEVKAIYDELPAYLNAAMVNSVIVFKDTASLESFLGVRLDKSSARWCAGLSARCAEARRIRRQAVGFRWASHG